MKAAELFVHCLENKDVQCILGVPGEEHIDIMDALLDSMLQILTTRHAQETAFMADVNGRLPGRAGGCLSTLASGATNLITGVADAHMDRAPVVAIAGQGATTWLLKERHQILDLVTLVAPITQYGTQIREAAVIAEIVRKAFKVAQTEKPGSCCIDFPDNIAAMQSTGKVPLGAGALDARPGGRQGGSGRTHHRRGPLPSRARWQRGWLSIVHHEPP